MDIILVRILTPPAAFADDEAGPGLKNLGLEQEEFWVAQYIAAPWNNLTFSDAHDAGTLAHFGIDQQDDWNRQTQVITWLPLSFSDDEISAGLKGFALEQEEFWTAQYQVSSWNATTFAREEEISFLFLEQEEPWQAQYHIRPWLPLPFTDDEISAGLKNFGIDQEEPWVASWLTVSWTARAFSDDEANSLIVPTVALEQEENPHAERQSAPWLPMFFGDDETGTGLKNFGLEQEEPWTAQYQVVRWLALVFADEETRVVPSATALDQEEAFQPQTQAFPWRVVNFWTDEEGTDLAVPPPALDALAKPGYIMVSNGAKMLIQGGFLQLTSRQKSLLQYQPEGLVVYDTTLHKLCVKTAGGWETFTSDSSGGSADLHTYRTSGGRFTSPVTSPARQDGIRVPCGQIQLYPFPVPAFQTFTGLEVYLTTAGPTGSKLQLAVYNTASPQNDTPLALVAATTDIAIDGSPGLVGQAISFTLSPGLYYFAANTNSTNAGAACWRSATEMLHILGVDSATGPYFRWVDGTTGTGITPGSGDGTAYGSWPFGGSMVTLHKDTTQETATIFATAG